MNAGAQDGSDLSLLLLRLEKQLIDPAFRKNREAVSALLAADFREFGSSGREWGREAIIDLLATEDTYTAPEVEAFTMQRIGSGAALVTYRTIRSWPISAAFFSAASITRFASFKVIIVSSSPVFTQSYPTRMNPRSKITVL